MVYTASKPAGTDIIKDSDDIIKDNFTHIVAAINQEHGWDNTTAANCIHDEGLFKSKVGTFTRALDGADGDVAYTGVGFKPQVILFFAASAIYTSLAAFSLGGTTGASGNKGIIMRQNASGVWSASESAFCIVFNESTHIQTAVLKTFDSDGFTLTWTKTNTPSTQTISVFYLALRFSSA